MKFLLPLLLFTSCALERIVVPITNTAPIGDGNTNTGNTTTVIQDFGDTLLTPEQVKQAEDAYTKAKDSILKSQAALDFIDSQVKLPYESNITRKEYNEKFPIFIKQRAHRDLVTMQYLTYRLYPKFKPRPGGLARSRKRQKEHYDAGRSQTMNSRHLRDPVQAVDVLSTRGYFPDRKGENVDAEAHGHMLGLQDGLSIILAQYPCDYFASIVERVFLWNTIRDLFHRQVDPRPECKENYHKYVET